MINNYFTYENQGSETLLVHHLNEEEHLDGFAKGMLQGNEIAGIIRPSFMQVDSDQYLKYSVTSKIPLKDYLEGEMERGTVLKLCFSVLEAIHDLEEYMLAKERLILDIEYIFVDISKKEASFLYIPVDEYSHRTDEKEFIRYLLSHMRYGLSQDVSYVVKIFNFLNNPKPWEIQELQRYIKKMMDDDSRPVESRASKQPVESRKPIPPLPLPPAPESPAENLVKPVHTTQEPIPVQESRKTGKKKRGLFSKREKKETPQNPEGMKIMNGIDIPGMPPANASVSGNREPEVILDVDGEGKFLLEQTPLEGRKKGGIFRLGIKKKDSAPPVQMPAPSSVQPSPSPIQPTPLPAAPPVYRQQNEGATIYMGHGSSDDDNRTVIMGGGTEYGSTVILGGAGAPEAQSRQVVKLTRRRNGQSMMINKEVFHIGREGSFVHFYIGDNPAIGAIHADIFADEGQYYVSDRNSLNHTYVNGVMVAAGQPRKLQSGDVITLADEDFDFIIS